MAMKTIPRRALLVFILPIAFTWQVYSAIKYGVREFRMEWGIDWDSIKEMWRGDP